MSFTGTLYAFQAEAVKKMLDRERLLVAYEMGLGKTVITIATIEHLLDAGEVATGLVVVPSSLKYQWKRMIDVFTEDATVLVIDGDPRQREAQYSQAITDEYDYVICNYEQIVNDWDFVSRIPYDYVVVDEATAIKSFTAKRSRRIKKLKCRYRYALSGQPIENRPEEVFSIMQWVDPELLGRFDTFDKTFIKRDPWGKPRYYKNLPTLHRKLSEAMVRKRRTDPDVRDQLPKVSETVLPITFDDGSARLYRLVVKELLADIAEFGAKYGSFDIMKHYGVAGGYDSDEMQARGLIMSKLTTLRMLCDNVALIEESARKGTSAYAIELRDRGLLNIHGAPKLKECLDLIDELLAADPLNKVVVFSFFKGNLHLLKDHYLFSAVEFHGEMNAKEKDRAKTHFQTDPHCRIFLSSDAGGYGVDLPEANYLVNYDLPWSAGKLDQRNARIVRLSSAWESVTLVNLIMRGSIEERMYDMLTEKRAIASAVVDGRGISKKGTLALDLKSLTEFLSTSTV